MGIELEHKHARAWELDPAHVPLLREGMALKPWQHLGITFLHYCRMKFGYGCLADEMGVGKVYCSFTMSGLIVYRPSRPWGASMVSSNCRGKDYRTVPTNVLSTSSSGTSSPFCVDSDLTLDSGMTPVSEAFRVNPESIQSLEFTSLTGSPVTLQANWVRESQKFFDPEQLRVRLWT